MSARDKIKQFIAEVIDTADWHEYPRRRAIAREAVPLYLWCVGHGVFARRELIQEIIEQFEERHFDWSEKALALAKKRVIPLVVNIMSDIVRDIPKDDLAVLGAKAGSFLK